jgi:peptidyl-prolyl cis-trans isomerase C
MSTACAPAPRSTPRAPAVSVNGVAIPRAAIAQETQHHPAAKPLDAMQAATRALVVRELLLQEARRLHIQATPDSDAEGRRETEEEALVRTLVEREVATPQADEAACRRYYNRNPARFRSAPLCEVRHILLAAAPDDTAARSQADQAARDLLARLAAAPADFADMAETFSACPSGKTGGNLGQIGPGQTVPEFERALAGMAPGRIHPAPVPTRYGLHIIALDRRIEGRKLPFEMVQDRIAAWLDERVRRAAIRQYIAILAGHAEITGIDLAASPSSLVQ